eukprot:TRINITY_DN4840_c0_g2_i1.p1 TRINITY_DN4840_c0_g2~~TRINITY_DN4840_c0_g2_i1.p1  ORF type:complete len:1103 (+),score=300.04 TRINITY_DN4840_c0_g2_i1:27-3311(+)
MSGSSTNRSSTPSLTGNSSNNNNGNNEKGVNVQVVVRARPMNPKEIDGREFSVLDVRPERKEITFVGPKSASSKTFTFDTVYGTNSTQKEVFDNTVVPIVDEVLKGFNCTIFCYGQTGTGKTYTMEGDSCSIEHAGIIPRSIHYIFDALERSSSEYTVRVSHLELYNEELHDLLSSESKTLRIYEDMGTTNGPNNSNPNTKRALMVNNLEEVNVSTAQAIFNILDKSTRKRMTAETLMNKQSSRSHCVFTIIIHTKEVTIEGEDLLKVGKLNLVDLAGAENVSRSGATDQRKREAGMINQSLLTLGRVITALTEHSSHIPYRESKLTRLLQESLGGKTKTCIIATVSPSSGNIEETLSTLDYAHRAKNIKNRPEVNQKMTKKALIKEYTQEIELLRNQLATAREKDGVYLPVEQYNAMDLELKNRRAAAVEIEQAIEKKEAELDAINKLFKKTKEDLLITTNTLTQTQGTLQKTIEDLNVTSNTLNQTQEVLQQTQENLEVTTQNLTVAKETIGDHETIHQERDRYEGTLKGTLNNTINSIDRLHEKIERKKSVEEENRKRVLQGKDGLSESISMMNDSISRFREDHFEMFASLDQNISTFGQQKTVELSKLHKDIQTLSGILSSTLNSINNLTSTQIQSYTQNHTQIQGIMEQNNQVINSQVQSFLTDTNAILSAFKDMTMKHQSEICDFMNARKSWIQSTKQNVEAFSTSQYQNLASISQQVTSHSTQQISRLTSHKESLRKMAVEQQNNAQQFEQELMSKMREMMEQFSSRQKRDMEEYLSQVFVGFEEDTEVHTQHTQLINSGIAQVGENLVTFAKDIEAQSIEEEDSIDRFASRCDETQRDRTENVELLNERSIETVKQLVNQNSIASSALQTQLSKDQNDMSCYTSNLGAQLSYLQKEGFENISESTASVENVSRDIAHNTDKLGEELENFRGHTDLLHTNCVERLDCIRERVGDLALKDDIPTGQTPQKRQITVPQISYSHLPLKHIQPAQQRQPSPRILSPSSTQQLSPVPNGIAVPFALSKSDSEVVLNEEEEVPTPLITFRRERKLQEPKVFKNKSIQGKPNPAQIGNKENISLVNSAQLGVSK